LTGLKKAVFFFVWYWLPDKRASVLTVVSLATRDVLLQYLHCDPDKIRVIHNCVSDDFKPSPRAFDSERPILLQVGTRDNKNILRVAEALKGIPCHLRIIGELDKEQLSALSRYRIDHSAVAGLPDKEMVREYENADMLVFASTYEGFGLPIIEANAVGRPVVTSNILSMPEVAGTAACLVEPFDIQDIRKGILRVICDKEYREDLVARGYENVKRFQSRRIAAEYARLYEEVNREAAG
jgi:glycosyltransferase involved in cell wall biosynthesis